MTDDLPDGIFFDLAMERYVGLPRLGAHGLGNLLVSPATFWEASWLNPNPRKQTDAQKVTRTIGSAYHCARLEPEHFDARYVRELDKADAPEGTLFTAKPMEAELKARVLKVSGSVAEQAQRLADDGFPRERLWHLAEADWREQAGDRIPLSAQVWGEIATDGERLRQSPEIAALLDGGFAEVSILWTDDKGVKCKCRPDKLNVNRWLDLKTFANGAGKPVEQAINDAIRYYKYHVGAAHYRDGIEAVRGGLAIIGDATDAHREMIAAIQARTGELACHYVFQEKGGVPNILAKRFRFFEADFGGQGEKVFADRAGAKPPEAMLWFDRARREIRKAKRLFRTYSDVYQPGEPWLPFSPLSELTDLDFHPSWLDAEAGE